MMTMLKKIKKTNKPKKKFKKCRDCHKDMKYKYETVICFHCYLKMKDT